ncbi:MAG TPA: hypothetical protein VHN98_00300 [Acidimicrobiales bacterium]|nr:hypothetical protein [Acidimicrobiales bacterium]
MSAPDDRLERLVRWYPPRWRDRYGDELIALCHDVVGDRPPSLRFRASIAAAGLRERAFESGLTGRTAPQAERTRTGALVVLGAWTLFVLAGAGFAKLAEHADTAVAGASRWQIDLAYTGTQALAMIAGLAVVAAALLALPAFTRYVKDGGWHTVRVPLVSATGATVAAAAGGFGLVVWARHVPAVDREAGAWPYGAVFVLWAATVAVALIAWSATAAFTARRLKFTARQLHAYAALSYVVVFAMAIMTIAVVSWWAVMGAQAPWFLHGSPPGRPASMVDVRVAVTIAVMFLADGVAVGGLGRIGRHPLTSSSA